MKNLNTAHPDISIVLPVYNEAGNISLLLNEIIAVLENVVKKTYEIIIVNDASEDRSMAILEAFIHQHTVAQNAPDTIPFLSIRIITQPTRRGQSKALLRGLVEAHGDIIITMDSDMQHDPADIPKLLEMTAEFDMVCGIRQSRADGPARWISSKIANAFRNFLTGDSTSDSGCTFRAMRIKCLSVITIMTDDLYGCAFFFHPLFVRRSGFSVGQVNVNHRMRPFGKSAYRLMRGRFLRGMRACFKVRKLLRISL